jgi:preprotein translocase subunit SecF
MSKIQGDRSKRTNVIVGAITAVVMVCVLGSMGVTIARANADAQAHTALMVEVKADGKTLNAAAAEDTALMSSVVEAGQITHIQAVAAEQVAVKIAAEEAARVQAEQQAAADLAAQQAAASKQTTRQAPAASSGASGAPAGTPLPMVQVTDPNNGQYGQMVPSVDPAAYCAAGSASTINGVPTCD